MFCLPTPSVFQTKKCSITHGCIAHLDAAQPTSAQKKPFKAFNELDFVYAVDAIVPDVVADRLEERIAEVAEKAGREAVRVTMKLGDILTGTFFTRCFKEGKVMMLSEVRADAEVVFTCVNGTLTMYLDKERYERSGLQGKPVDGKENRAHKSRWVVKLDLTQPAMSPGKKGFDRVIYACKNVFTEPHKWLFCNLCPSADGPTDHLAPLNPIPIPSSVSRTPFPASLIDFSTLQSDLTAATTPQDLEFAATDVYEWASLLRLFSPRITPGDSPDPYLSRYSIPIFSSAKPRKPQAGNLVKFSWRGLLAPVFVTALTRVVVEETQRKAWGFVAATTVEKWVAGASREAAMMRLPDGGEYLLWEVK